MRVPFNQALANSSTLAPGDHASSFQGQRHLLRTMAQCSHPRWLGLRRAASPRVFSQGVCRTALSLPTCLALRRSRLRLATGCASPLERYPGGPQVYSGPGGPQFQMTIPAGTGRLVPRYTPVLPAHQLQTGTLANTSCSVPGVLRSWRPTSSRPVSQQVPFARSPGLLQSWRLTSSSSIGRSVPQMYSGPGGHSPQDRYPSRYAPQVHRGPTGSLLG